jgi:hypothetical protein
MIFSGKCFAKLQHEKCDSDLYKGFFMIEMVQIHEILRGKISKSSDSYNKLLSVVNIDGFLSGFFLFLSIFFYQKFVESFPKN